VTSDEPDDAAGQGDGATVGDVQDATVAQADFAFQLRAERAAQGDGRIYTVNYSARDGSGHASAAARSVSVPQSRSGLVDPIRLLVQQTAQGTRIAWSAVAGAQFYNVIRGSLENLRVRSQTIELGNVTCVESRSPQTDTQHFEDAVQPALGAGFFYLVEYNDGQPSSYGEESAPLPRVVGSGGCN